MYVKLFLLFDSKRILKLPVTVGMYSFKISILKPSIFVSKPA